MPSKELQTQMTLQQNDRLFDNADVASIPDNEFRALNALDVSISRCLQKYEVIFQIVAQDKTEMNRSLVLLTWELVDWFERTRKILHCAKGIKHNEPAFGLISRSLNAAEDFRHILQHFDRFLKRSYDTDFAPLGAVSAIHMLDDGSFRALVYNAGTVLGNTNMGSVQLPEQMIGPVDYVTLQIDGQELNISEIARKLLDYYTTLRNRVSKKYPKPEQISA